MDTDGDNVDTLVLLCGVVLAIGLRSRLLFNSFSILAVGLRSLVSLRYLSIDAEGDNVDILLLLDVLGAFGLLSRFLWSSFRTCFDKEDDNVDALWRSTVGLFSLFLMMISLSIFGKEGDNFIIVAVVVVLVLRDTTSKLDWLRL